MQSKTRTMVFISNIPPFLLEPATPETAAGGGRRQTAADLRYKRLRDTLVDHSSGVMRVLHLQDRHLHNGRGHALALYASEAEALAACRATIIPREDDGDESAGEGEEGGRHSPLVLRVVRADKPPPPEAVYQPTITVEGEAVAKAELADTRGLEQAYRGLAPPRWCPRTLQGADCPLGVACMRLHRRACQRTVRKRPRLEPRDEAWREELSRAECALLDHLVGCGSAVVVGSPAACPVLPPEVCVPRTAVVPVTAQEVSALLHALSPAAGGSAAVLAGVLQRVEAAAAAAGLTHGPYYAKLSFPGGSPWDAAFGIGGDSGGKSDGEEATAAAAAAALRARCPLPPNGAPTPLEWDLYCQRVLFHLNQLGRAATLQEALAALGRSRRVREAFESHLTRFPPQPQPGAAAGTDGCGIELCVQPWLYLPTPQCEATLYLEAGGARVRGAVQRRGQTRVMVPSAAAPAFFSADKDGDPGGAAVSTYALLDHYESADHDDDGGDDGADAAALNPTATSAVDAAAAAAERALRAELRHNTEVLRRAAEACGRWLEAHTAEAPRAAEPRTETRGSSKDGDGGAEAGEGGERAARGPHGGDPTPQPPSPLLPSGAAWCIRLAVCLPDPSKPVEEAEERQQQGRRMRMPAAVALSVHPYQRALQDDPLYSSVIARQHRTPTAGHSFSLPSSSSYSSAAASAATASPRVSARGKWAVQWNVLRHHHVPLFDRHTIQQLFAPAASATATLPASAPPPPRSS